MKKVVLVLLGLVSMVSCFHESLDEKIARQTRDYTKRSCPKVMDKYTILDSMVYTIASKRMTYYYSLSGVMDNDSVFSSELLNIFHADLLSNLKNNMGLHELKNNDVSFSYQYYSSTKEGHRYMSFDFSPIDYGY